jgi:N-acetyl sugar amidotransferase
MDTTDPDIRFDSDGVCHHCRQYAETMAVMPTGEVAKRALADLVAEIKKAAGGNKYDCIIGVSGGVDSTFVAYTVARLGLKPLAVHLDNGWDSELAVANIHRTLDKLKIDLHTHVIDWEEFRELQLAFLRASTPDSEIPSDHAINALMHQMAVKSGLRYVVTGINKRTESHLPPAWSQGHLDWKYIRSVNQQFGKRGLNTFPHLTLFDLQRQIWNLRYVHILNYIDYVKKDAIPTLERELGWKYYGGKHYESIYTRFYQGYILPKKFGFDKRKVHLSSLICAGEITRAAALEELGGPTYPLDMQASDREYVIKKLEISEAEFEAIMALPKRSFAEFPSYARFLEGSFFNSVRRVYRVFKRIGITPRLAESRR